MKKFLAFMCMICPFCICARKWPLSRFAQWLNKMEKNCPACRAYRQIYGK